MVHNSYDGNSCMTRQPITFGKLYLSNDILTCNNSKWTIFIMVQQNIVYAPYLAEWSMESNRPSPLYTLSLTNFNDCTRLAW